MLNPRKLALLLATFIIAIVFFLHESTPVSIVRSRPYRTPSGEGEKTKEDIAQLLEENDRPLRSPYEFHSLREHLEYLFPYQGAGNGKFPAYIWQTWKFTPAMGEFDERFRMTEASWTERHPGYVHEVHSPTASLPLLWTKLM